ncbi:MAG: PliI family lysozyme inhibitor of I-type lysozyme [Cyanobacteriota bacterium]|nr:PliI family lysozyme inhibitor of I-type lysozyme [Cyanobacteriota bacterium]
MSVQLSRGRWPWLALLLTSTTATAVLAAPVQQVLQLQGVTFKVKAIGEGSQQTLQVKASEAGKAFPTINELVDGTVTGVRVDDLNSDGRPELFVFVTGAGSGSYGEVRAWTAGRRGAILLPIVMPELSGPFAEGYMGHDRFELVETTLARSFPIYKPGDSNARPTGGTRQVNYKLVAGEASWQLKPMSSYTFPQ